MRRAQRNDSGLEEDARDDVDAEAVELTRELYRARPCQYRNDIARRLRNYSSDLFKCGFWECAM